MAHFDDSTNSIKAKLDYTAANQSEIKELGSAMSKTFFIFAISTFILLMSLVNAQDINESLCEYATTVSAASENLAGSLLSHSLGAPDAPISGCGQDQWSGYGYSWSPSNWDVKTNLTLKFITPISIQNLTVFGDFDMCFDGIWLMNSSLGTMRSVLSNMDTSCIYENTFSDNFIGDTVILQTCGTSWSSTDSVRICGIKTTNSDSVQINNTNAANITDTTNIADTTNITDTTITNSTITDTTIIITPISDVASIVNNGLTTANVACLYGISASATSENSLGSLASYASGQPNAAVTGCTAGQWSGYGYSWSPANWNVKANLTIQYNSNITVKNLTVFGDYDMCINSIWLKNSRDGSLRQVLSSMDTSCTYFNSYNDNFIADTVIIQTCGTSWSSTDSVRICGIINQSNITIPINNTNSTNTTNTTNTTGSVSCQYAVSASATSENTLGSLASYATGQPNAAVQGCGLDQWSGYGYSWSPSNWNVKSNLTLRYAKAFAVDNLTAFGDYDICYSGIWLSNSITGAVKKILTTATADCNYLQTFSDGFVADTVTLETCGTSWSSTDAVQICGGDHLQNISIPELEICRWKDCRDAASSISMDDSYPSCLAELDSHNMKGTYFLTTNPALTNAEWSVFDNAFKRGHELGTHMRDHLCYNLTNSQFKVQINNNIRDITNHTSAKAIDLVSHAYPCGQIGPGYKKLLSTNWNFVDARGYNANLDESPTPADFYELKSYNSHGYPGGAFEPPTYTTLVDNALSNGNYVSLVFHVDCSDDGIIDYMSTKNVWVDTIGNVARYIKLRDSSVISNVISDSTGVRFSIKSTISQAYLRQNLTIRTKLEISPRSILINGESISYRFYQNAGGNYVIFDVPFPIDDNVTILR